MNNELVINGVEQPVKDIAELVTDLGGVSIFDTPNFDLVADMTRQTKALSTMKVEDDNSKIDFYNAISNPKKKLQDCVGEVLSIKDVYIEIIELDSEQTHKKEKCPRIVLIDTKGEAYQCVSMGVYSALSTLFKIYGVPTWENGLKLTPKTRSAGQNKTVLTLQLVK